MRHAKKQTSVIHTQEKTQAIETALRAPDVALSKDSKAFIINIFKELEETMLRFQKDMVTMSHQIENIHRDRNSKKQM